MNYFAYFSEIEERFQRRRGSILMLSTLDWALIETWREAGVPLEAVLRGIDDAFDKHDAKRARAGARVRKVNGLAWCAQAVMQATEEMQEASIGMDKSDPRPHQESGFEAERVAKFLEQNAAAIEKSEGAGGFKSEGAEGFKSEGAGGFKSEGADGFKSEGAGGFSPLNQRPQDTGFSPGPPTTVYSATSRRLRELATQMRSIPMPLDDLDRILTVLEERLVAALTNAVPEDQIVSLRAQADRELAPYRARMQPAHLKQVQQQFLLKRLLESCNLPRLSLFYMGHA